MLGYLVKKNDEMSTLIKHFFDEVEGHMDLFKYKIEKCKNLKPLEQNAKKGYTKLRNQSPLSLHW
jgi:hypothetical protein